MQMGQGVFVSNTGTDEWEADPEVGGDVHMLVSADGVEAGMSRFVGETTPFAFTSEVRETLLVLEGSVRIEIAGGPTLELTPGSMASLPAGAETTWHITTPFKEMWVLAGGAQA